MSKLVSNLNKDKVVPDAFDETLAQGKDICLPIRRSGVRYWIVSPFCFLFTNLHKFSHRNYKVNHEFKTREVHEKWS